MLSEQGLDRALIRITELKSNLSLISQAMSLFEQEESAQSENYKLQTTEQSSNIIDRNTPNLAQNSDVNQSTDYFNQSISNRPSFNNDLILKLEGYTEEIVYWTNHLENERDELITQIEALQRENDSLIERLRAANDTIIALRAASSQSPHINNTDNNTSIYVILRTFIASLYAYGLYKLKKLFDFSSLINTIYKTAYISLYSMLLFVCYIPMMILRFWCNILSNLLRIII